MPSETRMPKRLRKRLDGIKNPPTPNSAEDKPKLTFVNEKQSDLAGSTKVVGPAMHKMSRPLMMPSGEVIDLDNKEEWYDREARHNAERLLAPLIKSQARFHITVDDVEQSFRIGIQVSPRSGITWFPTTTHKRHRMPELKNDA